MSEEQVAIVRRKIGDKAKAQKDVSTGNGVERSYHLEYENAWGLIVVVGGAEKESPADYTLDDQAGRVVFEEAPADGALISIDYQWAAFTDPEIEALITETGSVDGAVVEALEELTVNASRLYDYRRDQTSVSRSQIYKQLKEMLDYYRDQAKAKRSGVKIRKRVHPLYESEPRLPGDLSRLQ